MEPLQFDSLYDLLAAELGKGSEALQASFSTNPSAVADETAREFATHSFAYRLTEPIKTQDGALTLLAEGADLARFLPNILARQEQSPAHGIGPITLAPSDSVVAHYRRKVMNRLTPAIDETRKNPSPVMERIFRAVRPEMHPRMDSTVERAAGKPLATSVGIMTMLEAVQNPKFDRTWQKSVQSAYTGMSVMTALADGQTPEGIGPQLDNLGSAALFQNLGGMLKPREDDPPTELERAALVASAIGLSPEVCELIVNRRRYVDGQEEPLDASGEKSESADARGAPVEARVLAVADIFVSAVNDGKHAGRDIEAIKALNFLVSRGKIDKRVVIALTRLYLTRKFALFFEKASDIVQLCPHRPVAEPILWNILGERNPQKFICQHRDCAYLGSQQTLVSQTIPVVFDGKVVGKIYKGEYMSCRHLTAELAKLYKEIAAITN